MELDPKAHFIDALDALLFKKDRKRLVIAHGGRSFPDSDPKRDVSTIYFVLKGILPVTIRGSDGNFVNYTIENDEILYIPRQSPCRRFYNTTRTLLTTQLFSDRLRFMEYARTATEPFVPNKVDFEFSTSTPLHPCGQTILEELERRVSHDKNNLITRELELNLVYSILSFVRENIVNDDVINSINRTYQQIDDYISDHCCRQITLASVADEFHLNPNYISRLFTQHGESFNRKINRLRMHRAVELMRDTDLSFKEIAAQCGIQNGSYFTKVFRRFYHQSPKNYRTLTSR